MNAMNALRLGTPLRSLARTRIAPALRQFSATSSQPAPPSSPPPALDGKNEQQPDKASTPRVTRARAPLAGGAGATSAAATSSKWSLSGIKARIKEYGPVGLVLYATMYLGPMAAGTTVMYVNHNFGLDPFVLADKVYLGDRLRSLLPESGVEPWQTSLALSWIGTELLEPLRLAGVLYLAPKVKHQLDARKAAKAET